MAGSLGELKIELGADIARLESGFKNASQIADKEMAKVVKAIAQTDATAAKTQAALEKMIKSLEGSPSESAFKKVAADAKVAEDATHKFGFETAAAKRELLVLVHELSQGNYKKFGGSMLVIGEQTGAAGLLFSAAGLGAIGLTAAIAGLTMAAIHGAQQQKAMNDALILTGNYAGLTSDSLNDLAHAAAASGGSLGEAKKAATQLAASGKFTGDQIGTITGAVVALEHATGASIEETIKQFESLAVQAEGHSARASTAVSQAASKLDEQYHFLTLSVYNQIAALEKEGDLKNASKVATEEFARVTQARSEEIIGNLGNIASEWHKIKAAIGETIDQVAEWGKKSTAASEVVRLQYVIDHPYQTEGVYNLESRNAAVADAKIKLAAAQAELNRENKIAMEQSASAQAQSEAVQAAKRVDAMLLRAEQKEQGALTTALKEYHAELDKIRAASTSEEGDPRLTASAIKEAEAALTKLHSHPAAKIKKDDPTQTDLMSSIKVQDALISQQHAYFTERERLISQSVAKEYMTTADGLRQKRQAIADDYAATQEMYAKEAASVVSRRAKLSPATEKKAIAEENKILAEIEAKRAKAAEASAIAMVRATGDQLAIQNDFNRATEEWTRKENLANDQRTFAISLMGKSTAEVAKLTEAHRIDLAVQEAARKLALQDPNASAAGLVAAGEAQKVKSGALIDSQIAKQQSGYYGATEAVRKYGEAAANTGAQIESALTNAFKSSEDALVKFMTTGKISFSGFAQSIIADMARIQAKSIMASLTGGAGGGGGLLSSLGHLFGLGGGDGGGYGSAGSFDYAPAAMSINTDALQSLDFLNIAGRFASGGSANAGSSYLVGEKGPEIFTPAGAGTVIPNSALSGGSASGTINYSPAIHIDSRTDQSDVHRLVSTAVQQGNANLIDQLQRAGRL